MIRELREGLRSEESDADVEDTAMSDDEATQPCLREAQDNAGGEHRVVVGTQIEAAKVVYVPNPDSDRSRYPQ